MRDRYFPEEAPALGAGGERSPSRPGGPPGAWAAFEAPASQAAPEAAEVQALETDKLGSNLS